MVGEREVRPGERDLVLPPEVADGLREVGGIYGLRSRVPIDTDIRSLAEMHQALSDPLRLLILYLLRVSDLCPCVLKEITELSDSKLSYHLSVLEKANMVAWRPSKNWRVYSLTELGKTSLP
ncbi:MAG: helix-turn-helix transcriptional regulator [Methanomassiliicoccales archaeon]|nr:helix-turn-helix transcriptional regulator [Methanomassiliicoccales archaeon]